MFRGFNVTKSEANKFIEIFAYGGGNYHFDLSWVKALFFAKEVFICFNYIFVLCKTCLN